MNFIVVFLTCIFIAIINGAPAPANGKYKPQTNEGRYTPTNEGKYVHKKYPYVHIHDNRELGVYKHIHIPYDGGFGPYSGLNIPYLHDGEGDYSLYTTTTTTTTTPKPRPTTTTRTTTRRPTKAYDDEGKWKIIRQEQEKNQKKYDFLFLTENGIYQEEQANTKKEKGTSAEGFYEYIGDDDKVYRVFYTAGEQGFIAHGDHIPTASPIPKEIRTALDLAAKKDKKILENQHKQIADDGAV